MYTAVRLSALFMLLTKVGTTWEISGLMNLILSLHFARVFFAMLHSGGGGGAGAQASG